MYRVAYMKFARLAEALEIARAAGLPLYSPIRRRVIWRPDAR